MKTLNDVEQTADIDARIIHAAGLLESTLLERDAEFVGRQSRTPSLGELVQRQEQVLGSDIVRQINFATRIRNRIAHPSNDEPKYGHKERAAEILISSLRMYYPDQPDCRQPIVAVTGTDPTQPGCTRGRKKKPIQSLCHGMRMLIRGYHAGLAGLKLRHVGQGGYVEDSMAFGQFLQQHSDEQLTPTELLHQLRSQYVKQLGALGESDDQRRTPDFHLKRLVANYLREQQRHLLKSAGGARISRPLGPPQHSTEPVRVHLSWKTVGLALACFAIIRVVRANF